MGAQNHVIVAVAMAMNMLAPQHTVLKYPADFFVVILVVGVVVLGVVVLIMSPESWKSDFFSISSGLVPRG